MVKVKLKLYGNVQGVFMRRDSKRKADDLKLRGYVRNIDDGTVELEAAGSKERIDELVEYCSGGCENGHVENIGIEYSDDEDIEGLDEEKCYFEIRY